MTSLWLNHTTPNYYQNNLIRQSSCGTFLKFEIFEISGSIPPNCSIVCNGSNMPRSRSSNMATGFKLQTEADQYCSCAQWTSRDRKLLRRTSTPSLNSGAFGIWSLVNIFKRHFFTPAVNNVAQHTVWRNFLKQIRKTFPTLPPFFCENFNPYLKNTKPRAVICNTNFLFISECS